MSEVKTYTIKPLEWSPHVTQSGWKCHRANTVIGEIAIFCAAYDEWWFRCNQYSSQFMPLEAAKAAAERWYVEQLEQSLTPTGE